jgi:hypothetical protein
MGHFPKQAVTHCVREQSITLVPSKDDRESLPSVHQKSQHHAGLNEVDTLTRYLGRAFLHLSVKIQ